MVVVCSAPKGTHLADAIPKEAAPGFPSDRLVAFQEAGHEKFLR
jgi:hypothetical protein